MIRSTVSLLALAIEPQYKLLIQKKSLANVNLFISTEGSQKPLKIKEKSAIT